MYFSRELFAIFILTDTDIHLWKYSYETNFADVTLHKEEMYFLVL
jgi:hypothetical protein